MASLPHLIDSEWNGDQTPLPNQSDFYTHENDLDGRCAWRNFGGLTRNQAYERFLESPNIYQEDFMFMGTVAFAYYYPVIERYLFETDVSGNAIHSEALILASCILIQLEDKNLSKLEPYLEFLYSRILGLAEYVRSNLQKFEYDSDSQVQLNEVWAGLEKRIANLNDGAL